MNFLMIPNKLNRTDYLITITFMFFATILIWILTVNISDLIGSSNNIFFSLFVFCIWIAKLNCSMARLNDIGLGGWWIISLLPLSPIWEITNITLLGTVIRGLWWIIPYLISEILLITLPHTKQTNILKNKISSLNRLEKTTLNSWNWGPFAFTFVWAIFHGFWLPAIISIIPGFGFIIGIILGIKGNQWAWQKDHGADYSIFIVLQHKWNKIGLICTIVFCIISILGSMFVGYTAYNLYGDLKHGKTYTKINHIISSNGTIIDLLGEPITINSFNWNQRNNLIHYEIDVKGSKNCGQVILKQNNGKTIYFVLMLDYKEKVTIVDTT